jgi:hypothetical protein
MIHQITEKMRMKRTLFMFFLIIFLATACSSRNEPGEMSPDADPSNLPNLVGTYVVNGVDPLGDEYGGHLTIQPGEKPETYILQWIVVGGIQEGTGQLDGNQLMVEWQTIEGVQDATGRAVFTITETGQLYGKRTADGLPGEGEEQAYPNQ